MPETRQGDEKKKKKEEWHESKATLDDRELLASWDEILR